MCEIDTNICANYELASIHSRPCVSRERVFPSPQSPLNSLDRETKSTVSAPSRESLVRATLGNIISQTVENGIWANNICWVWLLAEKEAVVWIEPQKYEDQNHTRMKITASFKVEAIYIFIETSFDESPSTALNFLNELSNISLYSEQSLHPWIFV